MERVPEPEVMDDAHQALAYARADFSHVNQRFADGVAARLPARGRVVDLGCGPADIPLRLTAAVPGASVVAVDASPPMLALARRAVDEGGRVARIFLVCARLPDLPLAAAAFDAVVSNSVLHHLPDPLVLWREVTRLGRPGAAVHVMDLFRPGSREEARAIVETAAADEDPILKQDFFNSLLAAWTVDEVRAQLKAAGLAHLDCAVASERHFLVSGRL
jgi:ubiquinone/menaquinone biosynthesis C-methylase UbiE